jgi:hypothetical protein
MCVHLQSRMSGNVGAQQMFNLPNLLENKLTTPLSLPPDGGRAGDGG